VERLEYDPNRTGYIALVKYPPGRPPLMLCGVCWPCCAVQSGGASGTMWGPLILCIVLMVGLSRFGMPCWANYAAWWVVDMLRFREAAE
jgi:hypothetical protein